MEAIMEAMFDFAVVGGAVVFSLGMALSLEWFALNTLMKMMPKRQPVMAADEVASDKPATGPALVASSFAGRKRAA
jgi:hypothetical protein